MTDLAKRLAEGPGSRELSDEVLLAMGWSTREFNSPGHGTVGHTWIMPDGGEPMIRPSPTESVDDALALVPEGWRYVLEECCNTWVEVHLHRYIDGRLDLGKPEPIEAVVNDTKGLPRAICIAVLKTHD